jgi:hypothetical protein
MNTQARSESSQPPSAAELAATLSSQLPGWAARFMAEPPGVVIRAALRLHAAVGWLSRTLLPGELLLTHELLGIARTQMIAEAVRLGLPDRLSRGAASAAELAAELDVHPDRLHRLLRALASHGVFRLRHDGCFTNSRLSRLLRARHPGGLSAFALYFASESNGRAWHQLTHTLRDGKNGFERALGCSVWEWLAENPEEGRNFARAMMGMSERVAPVIARIYPWAEVSRVCDVGGGVGTLLATLLREHPHLTGTLCDRAELMPAASDLFERHGVRSRATLVAADFFAHSPGDCDVYVLKHVLHDWDDARCLALLRACRHGAPQGARVLIAEQFLDADELDALRALSDVQMMVVSGEGRERSRAEYEALLRQAGFRPARRFAHPLVDLLEGVVPA